MFQSKPLIGTPNGKFNNKTLGKGLEFTPIGLRNDENDGPYSYSGVKSKARRNNRSPLHNSINGGSSFIMDDDDQDDSFDTINYSNNNQRARNAKLTSSPIPNGFDHHDLLNNGLNPVLQQQEHLSKLQDENYNLKIEISSLRKYLNSITTNDQQDLYQENLKLQQELSLVKNQLKNMPIADNKSEKAKDNEINNLQIKLMEKDNKISELNTALAEDDAKINELNRHVDDLNDKLISNKSSFQLKINELEDELENKISKISSYQSKISALEDELENRASSSTVNNNSYINKIEDLKETLHDVNYELNRKDEEIDNLNEKLIELNEQLLNSNGNESEIKLLNSKIKSQLNEINSLNDKIDKMERNNENLNSKINEFKSIIDEQQEIIKDLESNDDSNYRKYEIKLKNLKKELKDSELEISSLKESNDRTFKAYNDTKKQLNDLKNEYLESKNLGSDSNDVLQLEMEINKLNKKVDNLKYQNTKLVEELENNSIITAIEQKEKQIAKLQQEIKRLNSEKFEKINEINEINLRNLKLNSTKENEIKLLNLEINNLKEQYENEIKLLKNKDIKNDLLLKIEEKNLKIKSLNNEIFELLNNNKDLEALVTKINNNRHELKEEVIKLNEKIRLISKNLDFENNFKEKEFKLIKSDYLNEIDEMNFKYQSLKLQNKENLNKLEFLKIKNNKNHYLVQDLRFINEFMVASITKTNDVIKNDIKKLSSVGIIPDYEVIKLKKLKLSVLFKFVLSIIRLKRKTEANYYKNKRLRELSRKIEEL